MHVDNVKLQNACLHDYCGLFGTVLTLNLQQSVVFFGGLLPQNGHPNWSKIGSRWSKRPKDVCLANTLRTSALR